MDDGRQVGKLRERALIAVGGDSGGAKARADETKIKRRLLGMSRTGLDECDWFAKGSGFGCGRGSSGCSLVGWCWATVKATAR